MSPTEHCRHLLESLSEYIDGELNVQACSQLEAHLAGCNNCRIVVDTLRKTVYLYQLSSQESELPADARLRLYRKLNLSEFLDQS